MNGCDCASCRARDERRFWRLIQSTEWNSPPGTLPARIGAYGYTPILNLPPVPTWTGEPAEWEYAVRCPDCGSSDSHRRDCRRNRKTTS